MKVNDPNNYQRVDEYPDDWDFDDDVQICDYCGRDMNGYDSGDPCPYCCSSSYASGSEECDWCGYSDECYRLYSRVR